MTVMYETTNGYHRMEWIFFNDVLKKKKRIQSNMEKVDWGLFTFIWESKGKSGASKD